MAALEFRTCPESLNLKYQKVATRSKNRTPQVRRSAEPVSGSLRQLMVWLLVVQLAKPARSNSRAFLGGKFLRIKHISKLMKERRITRPALERSAPVQQAQQTEKPAAVNTGSHIGEHSREIIWNFYAR